MSQPVYWLSPLENCNGCQHPFAEESKMYDAKIPFSSWGNFCQTCFKHFGCKLGLGLGQEYTRQPDGRWLKTGG